ncbi:MAG TPA: hypothetical protein VFZ32_11790 [Micromonosporaceae bacterium]
MSPAPPDAQRTPNDPGELIFAAILKEAAPIADMPAALDAELAISALLGGAYAVNDTDRPAAVDRFGTDFGRYLTTRNNRQAGAVQAALAAVLPDPTLARAGGEDVPWAGETGDVTCTGTWAARDGYGDQTSYVATFAYRDPKLGGPEHAVSYLLDHNLGIVKSIWIGVPAERVINAWRAEAVGDPDITIAPVDAGLLRAEVTCYLSRTDQLEDPPEDAYVEERAFAVSRLALLPIGEPAPVHRLSDLERDEVVAGFLASPEAAGVGGPDSRPAANVVAWCARAAVDFAVDDNAGDPLRWSPTAVEFMLLDWAPRQLSASHDAAPWLPEVLAGFVGYAGRIRSQSPERLDVTQSAITEAAVRYTDLMTGDALGEPVSDILARMVADGVDPLNEDEVLEWVLADRARRQRD